MTSRLPLSGLSRHPILTSGESQLPGTHIGPSYFPGLCTIWESEFSFPGTQVTKSQTPEAEMAREEGSGGTMRENVEQEGQGPSPGSVTNSKAGHLSLPLSSQL